MPWFITRYCLTLGIQEVLGEVCDRGTYVIHENQWDEIGVNAFATIEEAREDQQKRAVTAIASAEKKIAKLKEIIE